MVIQAGACMSLHVAYLCMCIMPDESDSNFNTTANIIDWKVFDKNECSVVVERAT